MYLLKSNLTLYYKYITDIKNEHATRQFNRQENNALAGSEKTKQPLLQQKRNLSTVMRYSEMCYVPHDGCTLVCQTNVSRSISNMEY